MTREFQQMKEAVLLRRPTLATILQEQGATPLGEYARNYFSYTPTTFFASRKHEAITVISEEAGRTLGDRVGQAVKQQLERYYFVNTADHHGPISQSYFVNSNAVTALAGYKAGIPEFSQVIVLAAANVALNNASFPRGLLFHNPLVPKPDLDRILLLSNNTKPNLVYGLPGYTQERIEEVRRNVENRVQQKTLAEQSSKKLSQVIEEVYLNNQATALDSYDDQVTYTNSVLWPKLFPGRPTDAPGLVYLPIEWIVARLICDYHITSETILHRLLFDPEIRSTYVRHFSSIQGGTSSDEKSGTYLFWVLPKGRKQRMRTVVEGDELVSSDGSWRIPFQPETIREGLLSKELIPGLALDFTVLSFYYGLQCLGGFSQVDYLSDMKAAYQEFLKEIRSDESPEAINTVPTTVLNDNFSIAYLESQDRSLVVATGPDLLLYGKETTWQILEKQVEVLSIEEVMDTMIGDSYRYIAQTDPDLDQRLTQVSDQEIIEAIGLRDRIQPSGEISL